ncbi:MAG: hypothetical protein ACJ73S_20790 [Mycobacteriales bacterium]
MSQHPAGTLAPDVRRTVRLAMIARVLAAAGLAAAGLAACGGGGGASTGGDGLQTRPAGYVGTDTGMPPAPYRGLRTLDPAASSLVGPRFGVRFGKAEVSRTYANRYRAAPGQEFLVLYSTGTPVLAPYPDGGGTFSLAVTVDGRTLPVASPNQVAGEGLVVSVPKGHHATLALTDDGRTQSLDVRTGTRGPDAVAPYYRNRGVTLASTVYAEDGHTNYHGTRDDTVVRVDFDTAGSVEPWVPGLGWASAGRGWLVLSTSKSTILSLPDDASKLDPLAWGARFTLDTGRTYTVSYQGGSSAARTYHQDGLVALENALLFDVPDTFTAGTLTIHPAGDLRLYDGGAAKSPPLPWSQPPPTRQIALNPAS